MEKNKTAALQHLKRVSDFLELGDGVWYRVHDTGIEFHDGFDELAYRDEGPIRTHFRYVSACFMIGHIT